MLRSYQTNIGVQRDLGHDMVISVDWARRQGENTNLGELDLNRFQRVINGAPAPVIPTCAANQYYQAGQECSTGSITFWVPEGRSVYDGLLVKLNKRFSHGFYFIASYALSKSLVEDATQNLDNYFAGYGPNPGLPKHILNVAGSWNLPWGFTISMNSSIQSRTPVEPLIPGVNIVGTENGNTALSAVTQGDQFNCFAYSCGKSDLVKAVQSFNANWAGKTTSSGATIPTVVIPPDYQFDDPTFSQDFRITKRFTFKERYKFSIMGEFFNAFNIANLTYFAYADSEQPRVRPADRPRGPGLDVRVWRTARDPGWRPLYVLTMRSWASTRPTKLPPRRRWRASPGCASAEFYKR